MPKAKPVSLHPLTFEKAIKALIGVSRKKDKSDKHTKQKREKRNKK